MPNEKVSIDFYKDKIGQVVKEGDYIVYGHALGRSAALKIGKVLSLYREGTSIKIKVIGVDDNWCAPRLGGQGVLSYPNRTIKLALPDVPESHTRLLENGVLKGL